MSAVLFSSNRPLVRAENISALFNAYDGRKDFCYLSEWSVKYEKFDVIVADDFPQHSPGLAIMIGHGIPGGKTFGLDQPHSYHSERYAGLLDYVITSSRETVDIVATQSGVSPDKVLPLGMPRTDQYIGKKKGDGNTFLSRKRAYLYIPTFRNGRCDPSMPDVDYDLIDSLLTDDEVFVVKPHVLTGSILHSMQYRHIKEVISLSLSAMYLMDADVVITDYSSIMFDAMLLSKPVILFDHNMGYLQTRGMYYRYPSGYSGRWCNSERALIDMARTATSQTEEELACKNRVASMCDGHATERVLDLVRSLL